MSTYNLRPYIGGIPLIGGYHLEPHINTDGGIPTPFASYDFSNASDLISGAGPNDVAGWVDEVGSNDLTQLTPANQPLFNVDRIEFDGDDQLDSPSQTDWFPTDEATIFIKLNGSDSGSGFQQLLRIGAIDDNGLLFFQPTGGKSLGMRLDSDTLDNQSVTMGNVFTGVTQVIAFVIKSSGDIDLYRDGSFLFSSTWTGNTFSNTTSKSMELGGTSSDFNGSLLNFRAYDTALTATEVADVTASL